MKPYLPREGGSRATNKSRVRNRQKILDVSAELFARRGFDGVSIRDIGDAADVHGATIYHYFGEKRALYELVMHTALERLTLEHIATLEGPGDARNRLNGFLVNLIRSLIRGDVNRKLIERMFDDALDWVPPVETNALSLRFQVDMRAIIDEIVPGSAQLHWEEISGVINGIPHGMFRSRRLYGHLALDRGHIAPETLAGLLTDIVIAALRVLVEKAPAAERPAPRTARHRAKKRARRKRESSRNLS